MSLNHEPLASRPRLAESSDICYFNISVLRTLVIICICVQLIAFSRLENELLSALLSGDSTRMATGEDASALQQLVDAVTALKEEFSTIKRAVTEDRESAEERLVKRIRLDPQPSYRKKSHEKQIIFNSAVEDKLDLCASALEECASALEESPPAVEKAKEMIREGKKLIATR